MRRYKRPVLFSSVSLAAAIALFVGVLWPAADPKVYAARIKETLARQSQQNPVIRVQLDALKVDEVSVEGVVHVGPSGVAGDLRIAVQEDEGPLNIDAAIGSGKDGTWVLVRKVTLPDPQAQAMLGLFMPPGQETLVLLPKDADVAQEISGDIQEGLRELQSGHLIEVFKELIDKHAEYGVTVEKQPDGTVRLILPIEDEEALEALARLAEELDSRDGIDLKAGFHHGDKPDSNRPAKKSHVERHIEAHAEDHSGLIGATLSAVYDPADETVRMLSISGLGERKGTITITIGDGDIDPALLDSASVAKPGTRTLDLAGIASMIEGFKHDKE